MPDADRIRDVVTVAGVLCFEGSIVVTARDRSIHGLPMPLTQNIAGLVGSGHFAEVRTYKATRLAGSRFGGGATLHDTVSVNRPGARVTS